MNSTQVLDWTQIIIALGAAALPVIGAIAVAMIQANVKDKQLCNTLENAVQNSLGILQQAAAGAATLRVDPTVQAKVPTELAPAVQYVANHAGEAMQRFGVTPEAV